MPQFDTHFLEPLVFWALVSFGILLFLLYKFALPPVMGILEDRQTQIRKDLDEAERIRREAEERFAQAEARLREAHNGAEEILRLAREREDQLNQETRKRLNEETQRMLQEAQAEIARERERAVQDIRDQTVELSLLAAEKLLERNLRDEENLRFVRKAIETIPAGEKKS